jgi:hypothetical protein
MFAMFAQAVRAGTVFFSQRGSGLCLEIRRCALSLAERGNDL